MTTPNDPATCPMPRDQVVTRYFLDSRAKLLDVAAFLDRLDRSAAPADADEDFRVEALQRAIALLIDEKGEKAERVLKLLSDPTADLLDTAPQKGADGAYKPQ